MTHVVFLNGPPRSGKDTAGRIITEVMPAARVTKFAAALKVATHALFYGLHGDPDVNNVGGNVDLFEHCKDEPHPTFFGETPRNAYIAVAERLLRPVFGREFFGQVLARTLLAEPMVPLWAITDSGFNHEADTIIRQVGRENCTLVRLHRDGCTFAGDSRAYIDLDVPNVFDLNNNGTEAELAYLIRTAVLGKVEL